MKNIFILLMLISASLQLSAQKKFFIRVYDQNDKKISKGQIWEINDSVLILTHKNKWDEIPVSKINFIKTRRGPGNSMAIGAIIGAVPGILTGFAVVDMAAGVSVIGTLATLGMFGGPSLPTAGDYILGGLAGGVISGAIGSGIALIIYTLKKSEAFDIHGNPDRLIEFRNYALERNQKGKKFQNTE